MTDKTNGYHENQYEILSQSGHKIIVREEEYDMDADDIARWDLLSEELYDTRMKLYSCQSTCASLYTDLRKLHLQIQDLHDKYGDV